MQATRVAWPPRKIITLAAAVPLILIAITGTASARPF